MAIIGTRGQTHSPTRMPFLKRLFWAYFLLLIFEGALRKWIVPQLAGPLLLVRDPIALLIIWEAYRTQKWPKQWSSVAGVLSVALLALCFIQLIAGDNPWFVAVYGLRSYLLPFPVAFIMGENLNADDLRKFGICTLWLLLPLTALEVAQYLAPPSSLLNAGAYKGTEQLAYAGGHVRASSTFSYVTGPSNYIPLAAGFMFFGIVNKRFAKKWLLWAAAIALFIAVPVTGSRTVLVLLLAVLTCVAIAAMFGVSQLASSLRAIALLFLVALAVSRLSVFSEATNTFQERLIQASESEGGSKGTADSRLSLPLVNALENGLSSTQWYGNGMGLGSNAAAMLLTGTQTFLAGEGEVERIITEFGPAFGIAFLLFRFLLATMIAAKAFVRVRERHPLAWFLVPVLFPALAFGTLEQPTVQGFMVVALGFTLAALNEESALAESALDATIRLRRVRYRMSA